MVCLIHGGLTAIVLRRFATGFPRAVGLHLAGNLPFYLQEIGAFGLSPETWIAIVRAWVLWYFFLIGSVVWKLAAGDFHLVWLLFGDVRCPRCGTIYPRVSLSWTFRVIHQDHCPNCGAHNDQA
jgi:hypothetical protein